LQQYQNPSSDACNYPPIKDNSADVIKVQVGLIDSSPNAQISCKVKGPDFTDENRNCADPNSAGGVCEPSAPTHIEARMCYSKVAYQNRPWRKKNRPYPEVRAGARMASELLVVCFCGYSLHMLGQEEVIDAAAHCNFVCAH